MAQIIIPTPLRKFTQNQAKITTSGAKVEDVLNDLTRQFPNLRPNLLDEQGNIRQFVRVYVGDEDIKALQNGQTPVDENAVISIIPAIAGGSN